MILWETGTVIGLLSDRNGVQMVWVRMQDGSVEKAIHYTDASTRPLLNGHKVLLNVTAGELGLGTGGFHFVAALLEEESWQSGSRDAGHIMKLRYTPWQRAALSVEEEESPYHGLFQEELDLGGLPVLIGELHSMLPAAVSWIRHRERHKQPQAPLRIVYVMTDGAALPLAWSEHVAHLNQLGWLESTLTYGQAYGGQLEAVNKFSALLAAKHVAKADLCIAVMGPGIVGTGTLYGHSGLEAGELVNAVYALQGKPILIPRISFADSRERHTGISHHTLTALKLAARCPAVVPLPLLAKEQQELLLQQWHAHLAKHEVQHPLVQVPGVNLETAAAAFGQYPVPITSMGRGLHEDEAYFLAVCAAAEWAYRLCNSKA